MAKQEKEPVSAETQSQASDQSTLGKFASDVYTYNIKRPAELVGEALLDATDLNIPNVVNKSLEATASIVAGKTIAEHRENIAREAQKQADLREKEKKRQEELREKEAQRERREEERKIEIENAIKAERKERAKTPEEKQKTKVRNTSFARDAISNGNLDKLKEIFKNYNSPFVNGEDNDNTQTGLLHHIAGLHFIATDEPKNVKNANEIVSFLIKQGADVNLPDKNGLTPLAYAVETNNPQLVELLLKNGANPNTYAPRANFDTITDNLLVYAKDQGKNPTIQKLLLDYGADAKITPEKDFYNNLINKKLTPQTIQPNEYHLTFTRENKTPLMIAIETGQTELALHLMQDEKNLLDCDFRDNSALLYAIKSPDKEIADKVASLDPNIFKKRAQSGTSTFIHAFNHHDIETVQKMLDLHIDPNQLDDKNYTTPLFKAIEKNDYSVAKLLAENGGKLYNKYQAKSLLNELDPNSQMAQLVKNAQFIDKDASIPVGNINDLTEQFKSTIPHQVIAMVEKKEGLNKTFHSGILFFAKDRTVLQCAVEANNIKAVRYLLENGADPNIISKEDTQSAPLNRAVLQKNKEMVHLLLENKAQPAPYKNPKDSLLGNIIKEGEQDIALDFIQHKIDITSETAPDLIDKAIKRDDPVILSALLEQGATFKGKTKAEQDQEIFKKAVASNSNHIINSYLEKNIELTKETTDYVLNTVTHNDNTKLLSSLLEKETLFTDKKLTVDEKTASTLLKTSIQKDNSKLLSYFLEQGATFEGKTREETEQEVIKMAVENDSSQIINSYLPKDIELKRETASYVVNTAVHKNNTALLSTLLEKDTLFEKATTAMNPETAEYLIADSVQKDNPKRIELLLNRGATLKDKTKGETESEILDAAINQNASAIVHYQLEKNPTLHLNNSALKYAIDNNYDTIASELVKHSDLTKPIKTEITLTTPTLKNPYISEIKENTYPFEYALDHNKEGLAREILQSKTNLNQNDIVVALKHHNKELANMAMTKLPLSQTDKHFLLSNMIDQNNLEGLKFLHDEKGFSLDKYTTSKDSLLLYATKNKGTSGEIVQYILDNTKNNPKQITQMSLLNAVKNKNASAVDTLFKNGIKPEKNITVDYLGKIALDNNDANTLKILKEKGYDIEDKSFFSNETELMRSIENGESDRAITLIDAGANPNLVRKTRLFGDSATPLMLALNNLAPYNDKISSLEEMHIKASIQRGDKETVLKLIPLTDDLTAKNDEQISTLSLITQTNDPDIILATLKKLDDKTLAKKEVQETLNSIPQGTLLQAIEISKKEDSYTSISDKFKTHSHLKKINSALASLEDKQEEEKLTFSSTNDDKKEDKEIVSSNVNDDKKEDTNLTADTAKETNEPMGCSKRLSSLQMQNITNNSYQDEAYLSYAYQDKSLAG